jgi:hypothetical protein
MPRDVCVSQITLVVKDQTAALEFYTKKVGFEKKTDYAPRGGYRWVTVGPKGQDMELALFQAVTRDASGWSASGSLVGVHQSSFASPTAAGHLQNLETGGWSSSRTSLRSTPGESLLRSQTQTGSSSQSINSLRHRPDRRDSEVQRKDARQPPTRIEGNSGPPRSPPEPPAPPQLAERYQQVAPPIPHSMGVRVANRGRDQAQARSQGRSLRLSTWAQG